MPLYEETQPSGNIPAKDFNIQTPAAQSTGTANPPIPEDHAQQTPEFLAKLISELNTLRQEQSELFAKMYPMSAPSGPPVKPQYEVQEEYRRQDREFDYKMSALKMQIQELRVLIARPPEALPEPELTKEPGPTRLATDREAQSELAKGPAFPVQKQSGIGE